jgi:hypothetical protein
MPKAGENNPKSGQSAAREARLAAALRENLRRRKAQARGRGASEPPQGQSEGDKAAKDSQGG